MKTNQLVVTIKSWNIHNFNKLKNTDKKNNWYLITDERKLTDQKIKKINPRYIFFIHWSWIIPKEIYEKFECITFHMTDLPFGRGGSPLQNLISRGIYQTKISAIKVNKKIDGGDIYYKEPINISQGSAEEIFKKTSNVVYDKMIPYILENRPVPKKQRGKPVVFKRRSPDQSNISRLGTLRQVYDYIRMLDAEGYPRAFIETEKMNIEFFDAKIEKEKIIANCVIKLRGNKNEKKNINNRRSSR